MFSYKFSISIDLRSDKSQLLPVDLVVPCLRLCCSSSFEKVLWYWHLTNEAFSTHFVERLSDFDGWLLTAELVWATSSLAGEVSCDILVSSNSWMDCSSDKQHGFCCEIKLSTMPAWSWISLLVKPSTSSCNILRWTHFNLFTENMYINGRIYKVIYNRWQIGIVKSCTKFWKLMHNTCQNYVCIFL